MKPSYKYTGENTYDKEGDILKEVTESENTNKDGKVTGTDKSTTTYTYNQEKNERTVTENGESTSNNEYGVLIATEKISSTEKEKKFEAGDGWYYWTDVENNSDQTRLNKDGKIVYTKTSSSKDGVTKSETKSYDEFGVLSFGSSSVTTLKIITNILTVLERRLKRRVNMKLLRMKTVTRSVRDWRTLRKSSMKTTRAERM